MENAIEGVGECVAATEKNYRRRANLAQPGVAVPRTPIGRLSSPGDRCIANCKEPEGRLPTGRQAGAAKTRPSRRM
jgi:hypothetical protein